MRLAILPFAFYAGLAVGHYFAAFVSAGFAKVLLWFAGLVTIWAVPLLYIEGYRAAAYIWLNIGALFAGGVLQLFEMRFARFVNVCLYVLYAAYFVITTLGATVDTHALFALVWFGVPYLITGIFEYFLYRELAPKTAGRP